MGSCSCSSWTSRLDEARLRLAEAQLEVHRAKLSAYEEDARIEAALDARGGRPLRAGERTVEHWRGATLPMGLLYERAAVEFWTDVATTAAGRVGTTDQALELGESGRGGSK